MYTRIYRYVCMYVCVYICNIRNINCMNKIKIFIYIRVVEVTKKETESINKLIIQLGHYYITCLYVIEIQLTILFIFIFIFDYFSIIKENYEKKKKVYSDILNQITKMNIDYMNSNRCSVLINIKNSAV